jgi:hypothetical protein|tara:strand:+ start:647 stop:937 length:291 start_codon:yes stop_codon:yes gene_type:complete
MAITKETIIDKIEIINTVNIQVRESIIIKEDGNVISTSFNRKMYTPCTYSVDPENKSVTFKDTDLTKADPQVKAVANLQWTETNIKTWKDDIKKGI